MQNKKRGSVSTELIHIDVLYVRWSTRYCTRTPSETINNYGCGHAEVVIHGRHIYDSPNIAPRRTKYFQHDTSNEKIYRTSIVLNKYR